MFGVRTKVIFADRTVMNQTQFPAGFVWGVATSAQQIEGGRYEGGRGESIWDRFAAQPGRIADGSTPDVTCDHFHRWREDIALMRALGLTGYRFSVAWPRIFPAGRGPVNQAGLDFYDALVDGLLAAGLEPFPTLYHWDLPQALGDAGGWAERDTARAFADYAAVVTARLGDRVRRWTTHNEPWCAAVLGYEEGHHAPGLCEPATGLRAAHHLLLSHGWATAAIRAEAPDAEVGIVLIHSPAYPASESPADVDAARWFDGFFNRWYLDPLFRGAYPADAVADRVARGQLPAGALPFVEPGDLEAISAPLDFLGVNYYSRAIMQAGPDGKPVSLPPAPGVAATDMGWEVYGDGLRVTLGRIWRDYAPKRIYITENGAAYEDPQGPDGRIRDVRRIDYLRSHLLAARAAINEGVPLQGYFLWSLLDNFEWGYGFQKKFGLFAVDPLDGRRVPKDSADWYREVVAANAVHDAQMATSRGESRAFDD
jgi:beta-glucosidase